MRICDHPECNEKGEYPAPKSRKNLKDYFFFCLYHVRIYNKNWNYYDGMTASQIDAERDLDIIGHRPLWNQTLGESLREELNDFVDFATDNRHDIYAAYDEATQAALKLLQVPAPINLANIKMTYKAWVKKLHPDSQKASGGLKVCEESENKLKEINQAYAVLKLAFVKDSA